MVVGVLEVTLILEGNHSFKDKRRVVKSLLGRVKARFNCSASEVGAQNSHGLAVLGFTVCGSEQRILNSVLDRLLNFIEDNAEAEVAEAQKDTAVWSDTGDFEDHEPPAIGKD
ncbi:MAG: DUF503 domain-containing protein [Deltaproteobacteria bacterium]|nr:DUF503 domain-containing protein [Deltaproteobacteria bacterium]